MNGPLSVYENYFYGVDKKTDGITYWRCTEQIVMAE